MKLLITGALLMSTALTVQAQATAAQQKDILAYLKSGAEPRVKDATWTSERMLKVGMLDDGTQRDGYALYLCEELASRSVRGVSVQVIDIAKLVRTDKWVKLGEARCR